MYCIERTTNLVFQFPVGRSTNTGGSHDVVAACWFQRANIFLNPQAAVHQGSPGQWPCESGAHMLQRCRIDSVGINMMLAQHLQKVVRKFFLRCHGFWQAKAYSIGCIPQHTGLVPMKVCEIRIALQPVGNCEWCDAKSQHARLIRFGKIGRWYLAD